MASTTAASGTHPHSLGALDYVWLALGLFTWLGVFLAGTLVDSSPYRTQFAAADTEWGARLTSGLAVGATYTLTNVGVLCLLASVLGSIGARAGLGSDVDVQAELDSTAPRISALLRGFLVYLTLIAGMLVLADSPAAPTQEQYVRLAGVMSLVGFAVNYKPTLFGGLLARFGKLFEK